jgi:hypothetical protein
MKTSDTPRNHPAPGRLLSVMVENLLSLRERGLHIAPRPSSSDFATSTVAAMQAATSNLNKEAA